jgi:phosphate uptake regulator
VCLCLYAIFLFRYVPMGMLGIAECACEMGDLRKVQRTPTGTFFVCLPRAWAECYGLKKGALVELGESVDGKLVVDARYGAEPLPKVASLSADSPFLAREIVGRYLLGFDVIRVEAADGRIAFDVRNCVKETVGSLIGLEIVEETHSVMVLQCLLEPSGFPPEKILRRNYAIAAGMHRDALFSFVDGDLQLAKSVVARDDESNRLYFLLVRILRTIIQNPNLSEKLELSAIDCLGYRLAASLVESVGDDSVQIAAKTVELEGVKVSDELRRLLVGLQAACYEAHEQALKSFIGKDVAVAESVRSMSEKLQPMFLEIQRAAKAESLEVMPHVLAVASFMRPI